MGLHHERGNCGELIRCWSILACTKADIVFAVYLEALVVDPFKTGTALVLWTACLEQAHLVTVENPARGLPRIPLAEFEQAIAAIGEAEDEIGKQAAGFGRAQLMAYDAGTDFGPGHLRGERIARNREHAKCRANS